jgi:hypothetical protein
VFYSDLPWYTNFGFQRFNDRAAVYDGRTYQQFMDAITAILTTVQVPTMFVTGHHAKPHLPPPTYKFPLHLNEYPAVAYCYHFDGKPPVAKSAAAVLHEMADRFACVGDYCCGYGTAGRIFAQHGKRFVMSDFNPQCIGAFATESAA